MPNYTEFEGINLITDPIQKTIAEVLIKNELGPVSNGYQLDNANTPNSGYSFGGNQMDLSKNANGREIFSTIIKTELGDNFYNSIKDRVIQAGNPNILTQQEESQINSALSSSYGKQLINQTFVDEVSARSNHVDNFAKLLNTTFTDDVKIALIDYDNQFYIDSTNTSSASMRTKLQNILNQNGEITLEDVENSVRSTSYYNSSKTTKQSQETRIQETRKMIKDAGLVSDGSDSTTSLKNSLTTTLSTITVTAQKEAVAKSWFETFSDSLDSWTGSVAGFVRDTVDIVSNAISSTTNDAVSQISSWISSSYKTADQSLVQKNFTSLGINTTNFDITKNSFSNFTFINTSLKFDLTNTLSNYYNNSKSNYNNFNNLNFQISNPIQEAIKHIGNARNHASPLAIDLDGDGIETTHLTEGNIFFDIKNTGFANKVGWIKSDDGILALDRPNTITKTNSDGTITTEIIASNGKIDNVFELFGDYRMSAWDELKLLDTNKNNKIDAFDEQFNNLKIWRDLNQNGISEEDELKSLTYHNIKEINLFNINKTDIYQKENYISGNSSITYEGATSSIADDVTKQSIYDVHFLNDNLNTWHKGSQSEQFGNEFDIKLEALLLPLSRGYGELPSLHIALSKDEALLNLVTEFSTLNPNQLTEIPTRLENILYRWAGIDNINPTSVSEADGSNIDARKLRFIEKFTGVQWEQLGNKNVVGHFASLDIKKAWDGIFAEMLNRFTTQGPLVEIFKEANYDFIADKINLGVSYQVIKARIAEFVTNNNLQNQDFYGLLAQILYTNKADLNLSLTELNTDLSNIFNQTSNLSDEVIKINWNTELYYSDMEKGNIAVTEDNNILKTVATNANESINASNIGDYIFAKEGNDIVNGGSNEDYIDGGAGNDTINGNGDNDWLIGNDGNDTIEGAEGRDKITGDAGADILFGNAGNDIIEGGAGADIIDGGEGEDALTYYNSKLGVTVNLKTGLASGGDSQGDQFINIENVHGSMLADIITGDDNDNFLHGENGNDKLYGEGGNDRLFNGIGKAELHGGNGDDVLDGYDGAGDLLDGGEGIDTINYDRPDIETRLNINLETGKTIHFDRPKIIDGYNDFYAVLLEKDWFVYINSKGAQGVTYVPKDQFLDMSSAFRIENGNNFWMFAIEPIKVPNQVHAYDNLQNIENINAGFYADRIIGNDNDNVIYGNGGADLINAKGGNDIIYGDINGVALNKDWIGHDLLSESDEIFGDDGNDMIYGGLGNDQLNGGNGDDSISGNSDNDTIDGGAGNDRLDGGSGIDTAIYSGVKENYSVTETESGFIVTDNVGQGGVDKLTAIEKIQFADQIINLNHSPIVTLTTISANEDVGTEIDILANASDADNDTISIANITTPSNGTGSIITDALGKQKISYIPNHNFSGTDQFDYTISDGNGGVVNKTIYIQVNSVNDNPTATITSAVTNEDDSVTIDVLSDASDADGDQLSIAGIYGVTNGVANIVDGKIVYTPNANYSGLTNFDYIISDGNGGFVTKTLNIDVKAVNDAPIAANDSFATSEDRSIKILFSEILGNDSDIEDSLELQNLNADNIIFNNPQHGIIIKNYDSITYIPNANYHGNDSISYQIKDSVGASSNTATINLNITSVNDAPIIASIISNSAIDENAKNIVVSATIIISAFSDIDGDILNYKASLSNGNSLPSWLAINSETGEITSTNPSNNEVGNYELIVTATDSTGAFVSQNFIVTVNNVNDAPTSSLVTSSTNEDSTLITLAFAGSDIDAGDSLSYSILSNPAFGSVANNNNGTFTFNLGNDFQNLALNQTKDVSFTYVATDKAGAQSNISSATITVTGTNDAPTASITSIATNEDNSVKIDVLSGASDVDVSDVLSLTSVTNGLHGTASITTDANGNKFISYIPNANYNGNDVITYKISDNNGTTVTKELTVTVNAINDAPIIVSVAQNQVTESGKAFAYTLLNNLFSDIDADNLTIKATLADGSPLPSWLSFNGTKFNATPNVSTTTNFAIKLTATDSSEASISQNFGINVTNPNNAPIAKNDAFATNEDTSLTITFASILKNDSDVEDKTNILKLTKDNFIFNNPGNGIITVSNTGIIYKPNKNFNGTDSISYQIKDSNGALSNKASINLTVKAVNDIAIASNDSFTTNEDKPITIKLSDLLANDSDIEDGVAIQNLTLDKFVFSNPTKGKIVKDALNNAIIYTANKDYNGIDSLTYKIKDSNGVLSNKAKINLTVDAVNDAPIAVTKIANQSVKAGNFFSYTLPANSFSDVDKDNLTYSAKLADNSDLPLWLKFDATTKSFNGTSPSGVAFALSVKVIASDGSLNASQTFSLNIASNIINGSTKNDSLNGTALNDEICGNAGIDTIKAGAGNDLIIGGRGADVLLGGIGNDQFIFKDLLDSIASESDLILDFIKGKDKINLSNLGFDSITEGRGSNVSAHVIDYHFEGGNTIIDDQYSNFAVKLAGEIHLENNDFIF